MPKQFNGGLVLRGQRQMCGGKTLDGKVWLELDGKHRLELTPDEAFTLAKHIFNAIGIELNYEYGERKTS